MPGVFLAIFEKLLGVGVRVKKPLKKVSRILKVLELFECRRGDLYMTANRKNERKNNHKTQMYTITKICPVQV